MNQRLRVKYMSEALILWESHPLVTMISEYLYTRQAHANLQTRFLMSLCAEYPLSTNASLLPGIEHDIPCYFRFPLWSPFLKIDEDANVYLSTKLRSDSLYLSQQGEWAAEMVFPSPLYLCGNLFETVTFPIMRYVRRSSTVMPPFHITGEWTWTG